MNATPAIPKNTQAASVVTINNAINLIRYAVEDGEDLEDAIASVRAGSVLGPQMWATVVAAFAK